MPISAELRRKLLLYQRTEITKYPLYKHPPQTMQPARNRKVLERIAADERRHYAGWQKYPLTLAVAALGFGVGCPLRQVLEVEI